MTDSERGQVTADAATVYEDFFVPSLFGQWTERVAEAAGIRPGQRVLDVACGTGVLARAVAGLVTPNGTVVGIDPNAAMLAVARRTAPGIDWREGRAEALPFADAEFDAAVSQFGLMFFDDRVAALREMRRVVRSDGRVATAVWGSIDRSPGYAALADLLAGLFGEAAATALRAPFALGDPDLVADLMDEAGYASRRVEVHEGTARFPSIESWMFTEIRGWTLADAIDDEQFEVLLGEARRELGRFARADGTVEFAIAAIIAGGR